MTALSAGTPPPRPADRPKAGNGLGFSRRSPRGVLKPFKTRPVLGRLRVTHEGCGLSPGQAGRAQSPGRISGEGFFPCSSPPSFQKRYSGLEGLVRDAGIRMVRTEGPSASPQLPQITPLPITVGQLLARRGPCGAGPGNAHVLSEARRSGRRTGVSPGPGQSFDSLK